MYPMQVQFVSRQVLPTETCSYVDDWIIVRTRVEIFIDKNNWNDTYDRVRKILNECFVQFCDLSIVDFLFLNILFWNMCV